MRARDTARSAQVAVQEGSTSVVCPSPGVFDAGTNRHCFPYEPNLFLLRHAICVCVCPPSPPPPHTYTHTQTQICRCRRMCVHIYAGVLYPVPTPPLALAPPSPPMHMASSSRCPLPSLLALQGDACALITRRQAAVAATPPLANASPCASLLRRSSLSLSSSLLFSFGSILAIRRSRGGVRSCH